MPVTVRLPMSDFVIFGGTGDLAVCQLLPAPTGHVLTPDEWAGTGRELFASMRAVVSKADRGPSVSAARSRHEISAS